MKFEAKFKAEKNKLYTLDGTPVAAEGCRIITARPGVALDLNDGEFAGLCVNWNDAGRDEDSYNEEFLAGLRDQLKELEERHIFVFIIPVADSNEPGSAEEDAFIASFKHCARRIKDCECVAGFAVPAYLPDGVNIPSAPLHCLSSGITKGFSLTVAQPHESTKVQQAVSKRRLKSFRFFFILYCFML